MTKEEAREAATKLAGGNVELKPRDPGARYIIVQQGDFSPLYEVRCIYGKEDSRYRGSWDAEQIMRMFEPDPHSHPDPMLGSTQPFPGSRPYYGG